MVCTVQVAERTVAGFKEKRRKKTATNEMPSNESEKKTMRLKQLLQDISSHHYWFPLHFHWILP